MEKIRKYNLKFNFEKCEFWKSRVIYVDCRGSEIG